MIYAARSLPFFFEQTKLPILGVAGCERNVHSFQKHLSQPQNQRSGLPSAKLEVGARTVNLDLKSEARSLTLT